MPPAKVAKTAGPNHATVRRPTVPSNILSSNSQKLNLSKAQFRIRRKKTEQALRPIHCGSNPFTPDKENIKSINDGLWTTLINSATEAEMAEYIERSNKCMESILPKTLKNKISEYEKSQKN